MLRAGILSILLFLSVNAAASNCPEHYYKGFDVSSLEVKELCFDEFAVGYSVDGKVSLYATQLLSPDDIRGSEKIRRTVGFKEETKLPRSERARNIHYKDSGYDRGHLVAFKDKAFSESINSLVNVVPQCPELNRNAWKRLEVSIRNMILEKNIPAYVITGISISELKISGEIAVPDKFYKIVVNSEFMHIYIADNCDLSIHKNITPAQLQALFNVGIVPYDALPYLLHLKSPAP